MTLANTANRLRTSSASFHSCISDLSTLIKLANFLMADPVFVHLDDHIFRSWNVLYSKSDGFCGVANLRYIIERMLPLWHMCK